MPRMGGKNAQTTFSEFYLSMKQIPATFCPVLRVLIDWILELSILAPSQLIVMWESGDLGQNALSFVVVALKAETGRDLYFFFAPLLSISGQNWPMQRMRVRSVKILSEFCLSTKPSPATKTAALVIKSNTFHFFITVKQF